MYKTTGTHLGNPQVTHVVTVDLLQPEISIEALPGERFVNESTGQFFRRSRVSQLQEDNDVLVAMNTNFFDIGSTMAPLGLLMRDQVMLREPVFWANAFVFTDGGWPAITNYGFSGTIRHGASSRGFAGFNRETLGGNQVAVFQQPWDRSPGISADFTSGYQVKEVVLEKTGFTPPPNPATPAKMQGKVLQIRNNQPSVSIPPDRFVITATGNARNFFNSVQVNDTIEVESSLTGGLAGLDWNTVAHGVAGGSVLIIDGQGQSQNVAHWNNAHPRSAIGISQDASRLAMVVVEGRQPGVAEGMSLHSVRNYFQHLGAFDALEFDGGGSSAMAARVDGNDTLVSTPSDGSERYIPAGVGVRVSTGNQSLGGYYRIKAKHSGKYFDMGPDHVSNGASLQQFDWHGGSNQIFQLTHLGDGYYRIRAKSAPESRVLDVAGCGVANGSNVHQWDWFNNDCQKFRIEDVGGGHVRFVAKNSGRVLEVGGANGANGANINIWDWNDGDHQKFQVEWVSTPVTNLSGAYKVASAYNARVLDIAPDHVSNGAELQIYDWVDGNNQKFTFDHLGGGWYKIWAASAGNDKVLDVPACDFSNGTPLWQWDWFDNDCQKFLVEEVAPGQVRIKSVGGPVLDHAPPGPNGTNVVLWDWWGGANQRWSLESTVAGPPPQEFIVDNTDAGFSASGSWNVATWASDKYEADYHHRATESVSDPATWTVNLPSAGTYAVYAWWTAASNRATVATYHVDYAAGTANVQVDQTQNGGQWNSLGSYSMDAGANEIRLSCWTSSGDIVIADAVRYVKQ